MSSVNSTNASSFYNIYGVKNSGVGGLASGLNTDEIVQSLTLGTRTKIGRQTQQRTTLKWQQTAYRSITSVLGSFQDKHLSSKGSDPIIMSSFWKTYKASSTSDKVSFISSNTSNVGTVTIDSIDQLATKQTVTVNQKFEEDLIGDAVDFNSTQFYGKYLEIQVGDRSYNVRLDDMDAINFTDPIWGGNRDLAYTTTLQAILDREIGTYGPSSTSIVDVSLTASWDPVNNVPVNIVTLDSDVKTLRITKDCDVLGFTAEQRNSYNLSTTVTDAFGLTGDTFTFSINGVELTATKDTTLNQLIKMVNGSACGATLAFDDKTNQFVFTAQAYGSGNNIVIKDISGNLMNKFMGAGTTSIKSELLSEVHKDNKAPELGYLGKIEGKNAIDIDTLFTSGKNIVLSIAVDGSLPQTITILASDITLAADGDGKYEGKTPAAWLQEKLNQEISDAFGSEKAAFTFSKKSDGTYSVVLNTTGKTEVIIDTAGGSPDFDFFDDVFEDPANTGVAVTNLGDSTLLSDLFDPESSGTFFIQDFQGNTVQIDWGGGPTEPDNLRDLLKALNAAFGDPDNNFATLKNGRIVLDGGDYPIKIWEANGATDGALKQLFGDAMTVNGANLEFDGSPNSSLATVVAGENAVIKVNGGQTEVSHSNTFTVDGICFEVNAETTSTDTLPITLTVRMDTDELVDKISAFVDEYNSLIYSLNSVVNEKKVDGYAPLTDEQRAEMTEEQVKSWEAEAKKGILFNDSTIRTIIDSLRQMVNKEVGDSGISLYEIGISVASYSSNSSGTGYNLDSAGTLEIDFTKLRNAIETNPEAVRIAFSANPSKYDYDYVYDNVKGEAKYNKEAYYKDQGVAAALYDAIYAAIADTSDEKTRGSLITLAGKDNSSIADESTVIGRKIARIDEYINTLKLRLQNEYERHWSKFTALETAIQRMSAQSSWLNEFYA